MGLHDELGVDEVLHMVATAPPGEGDERYGDFSTMADLAVLEDKLGLRFVRLPELEDVDEDPSGLAMGRGAGRRRRRAARRVESFAAGRQVGQRLVIFRLPHGIEHSEQINEIHNEWHCTIRDAQLFTADRVKCALRRCHYDDEHAGKFLF